VSDLFGLAAAPVPLAQQIACVEREIKMRESSYPRWVQAGKMTQAKADAELLAMRAVLATLKGKHDA
jgi:hypothetical protein